MSKENKSSAELCRENGWDKGTVLIEAEAAPGHDHVSIEITAVGVRQVLAIERSAGPTSGGWVGNDDSEQIWNLTVRAENWHAYR